MKALKSEANETLKIYSIFYKQIFNLKIKKQSSKLRTGKLSHIQCVTVSRLKK